MSYDLLQCHVIEILVSMTHIFDSIHFLFFEILQELNEQKQLTETMRTSILKILYKKGDRRMIGNYRPLSLACTVYNIPAMYSGFLRFRSEERRSGSHESVVFVVVFFVHVAVA